MNHQNNLVRIKAVANALSALEDKVVFVGGATVSFYPDRQVFEARPTDDIDVIIEILNYSNRAGLEEKLREIGFSHDIESGVICRYRVKGIIVDIMPTDDPSIGFSNKWYPEGFNHAIDYEIDETCTVKILSAPHFIATKIEAFKGRGGGDGRTSQDFEDIVHVLENRDAIWEEMNKSSEQLKEYLRTEFRNLLNNPNHFDWIDGHVERISPPSTYFLIDELKKFSVNS